MQLELKNVIGTKCIDNKNIQSYKNAIDFYNITKGLLNNSTVKQMKNYRHHYNSTCYDHCLEVAYWSYLICKKLNLDYVSSARAGILHDLFLYDWRHSKKNLNLPKCHAFIHPEIALKNASQLVELNSKERDIILKHMWPVTFFKFPKYKESFIITFTDKLSALASFYRYYRNYLINNKIYKYAYVFLVSFSLNFFNLQK